MTNLLTWLGRSGRDDHSRARASILRHFTRGLAPPRERALRSHLAVCAACRAHYDDVSSVTGLDPCTPSLEDRLAKGLGFSSRRRSSPWRLAMPGLAGAAAVGGWLFFLAVRSGDPAAGFAARGRSRGNLDETADLEALPVLVTYAVEAGQGPKAVPSADGAQGTINARDELAFAYRNPTAKKHLMVFAIDEHDHVYWYHPGWPDPAVNPAAVSISAAPGLHELPAAVSQTYDGEHLMLHALFTDRALTVREVEDALEAARRSGRDFPEALRTGVHVSRPLRVRGAR